MNNASYIEKVAEYKSYIDTHKKNVLKMFEQYGEELCHRLNVNHKELAERLLDHDASKYSKVLEVQIFQRLRQVTKVKCLLDTYFQRITLPKS